MIGANRILVTGASGFLGGRLIKHFLSRGLSVIGTGRRHKDQTSLKEIDIEYYSGSLSDKPFVQNLADKVDAVVHCAALSSPWGRRNEFVTANIDSTINLVNAFEGRDGIRFVNIGTPSIYVNYKDRLRVKESEKLPHPFVNHYAATKYDAEQFVLRSNSSNIRTISLRPRAIIGAEDQTIFPRIIRAYVDGRLKIIGEGNNVASLTSVLNLIHAIELALKATSQQAGKAYNIADREEVELWPQINHVLEAIGYGPVTAKAPKTVVMGMAAVMETSAKLFSGKEPSLTRYGVSALSNSLTLDISLAESKLGYSPMYTTRQGLNEFIDWYKSTQTK